MDKSTSDWWKDYENYILTTPDILPRESWESLFCTRLQKSIVSSVESQKGITTVLRCSIENQKGAIAVQSLWWKG